MIIKKIADKKKPIKKVVFSIKKNNIFTIKVDKSIEIVVVPNPGKKNTHQDNVGIIIEEKKILKILSKRYKKVSITKIKNKKDIRLFGKKKTRSSLFRC